MNLPLLQPEKTDVPARIAAMLSAMKQQRDATADEVVNLCGDLADARAEIEKLKEQIAKFTDPSPPL